jgi:hypothetical protein
MYGIDTAARIKQPPRQLFWLASCRLVTLLGCGSESHVPVHR